MNPARALAALVLFAVACAITACTQSQDPNDPRQLMLAHLAACKIGTPPGMVMTDCTDPGTACAANCVTDASCDDINQRAPGYVACLNGCSSEP